MFRTEHRTLRTVAFGRFRTLETSRELAEKLCLSSDEHLQQFAQEWKFVQTKVDHICNQIFQIYQSSSVQLWQCKGLAVIHGFCGNHAMSVRHSVHSRNKTLWFSHILSVKAASSSEWKKIKHAARIKQCLFFHLAWRRQSWLCLTQNPKFSFLVSSSHFGQD